jgi:dTDP-4-dehydrorhamnose 3,5-epimerase|tara:strand:- start:4280 stop:4810 length:531 start_codon:yes stop_codon:yes gene_type:complete
MKIFNTNFNGLKIIKGKNYYDNRGHFREVFQNKIFKKKKFIFWCVSKSKKNIIRGLHLQRKVRQDLFISVIKGKIFDVVVDLRKNSKKYGKYSTNILSHENASSLFVPSGFAHGFCSLANESIVLYGISNYRSVINETGILWNDKTLNIKWPIKKPQISKKDKDNITFNEYNKLYL